MTLLSSSISRVLPDMVGITATIKIVLDQTARPLSRLPLQELPTLLTPQADLLLLQRLDPQPTPLPGRRLACRHQDLHTADLGLLSGRPAAHPAMADLLDLLVRVLQVQALGGAPAMAAVSAPDVKSPKTQAKEMAARQGVLR